MYNVVIKKFTFTISSPDEFLVITLSQSIITEGNCAAHNCHNINCINHAAGRISSINSSIRTNIINVKRICCKSLDIITETENSTAKVYASSTENTEITKQYLLFL